MDILDSLVPQSSEDSINRIKMLFSECLWHELTDSLLELFEVPAIRSNPAIIQLYREFICPFSASMSQIKFVKLAIIASGVCAAPTESKLFLEEIALHLIDNEAKMVTDIAIASMMLQQGEINEAQKYMETTQQAVENMSDIDSFTYSYLYKNLAQLYKAKGNREQFYRFSLQYLAYTPLNQVENSQTLSYELAIALLLAPNMYNIGELLEQPIFKALQGSDYDWLYNLMKVCDSGNVSEFESRLTNLPAELAENKNAILEKTKIISIMELVFGKAKTNWEISFQEISQTAKLADDQVEWILMKAMALDLLKGEIDEVARTASFKWVQPRVLNAERTQLLANRLNEWKSTVGLVLNKLEDESRELFD